MPDRYTICNNGRERKKAPGKTFPGEKKIRWKRETRNAKIKVGISHVWFQVSQVRSQWLIHQLCKTYFLSPLACKTPDDGLLLGVFLFLIFFFFLEEAWEILKVSSIIIYPHQQNSISLQLREIKIKTPDAGLHQWPLCLLYLKKSLPDSGRWEGIYIRWRMRV